MPHANIIVATTRMPFHWRWCAFMTKLTQIYMGREHVHHLYAHWPFSIRIAITMTLIIWYWVTFPTLDMGRERRKDKCLPSDFKMNMAVWHKIPKQIIQRKNFLFALSF
jgi:hypothetical protein